MWLPDTAVIQILTVLINLFPFCRKWPCIRTGHWARPCWNVTHAASRTSSSSGSFRQSQSRLSFSSVDNLALRKTLSRIWIGSRMSGNRWSVIGKPFLIENSCNMWNCHSYAALNTVKYMLTLFSGCPFPGERCKWSLDLCLITRETTRDSWTWVCI